MFKVAVRLPVAWGVNVTEIVHLPLDATLPPQVLVWAKSPVSVPVMVMPVMLSAVGKLFGQGYDLGRTGGLDRLRGKAQ